MAKKPHLSFHSLCREVLRACVLASPCALPPPHPGSARIPHPCLPPSSSVSEPQNNSFFLLTFLSLDVSGGQPGATTQTACAELSAPASVAKGRLGACPRPGCVFSLAIYFCRLQLGRGTAVGHLTFEDLSVFKPTFLDLRSARIFSLKERGHLAFPQRVRGPWPQHDWRLTSQVAGCGFRPALLGT